MLDLDDNNTAKKEKSKINAKDTETNIDENKTNDKIGVEAEKEIED